MLRSIFDIDGLMDIIRREHSFTPTKSLGSVERLERRSGLRLPRDMVRFYSEFDGARLFGNEYILLDPDGILPFDAVIRALGKAGPGMHSSWLTLCRTREGHWVAIDLAEAGSGAHPVAVLRRAGERHDAAVQVIAPSFPCFLAFALVSRRHPYWLDLN